MNKNIEILFYDLWRTIISYLPNLLAALLLLAVGWIIGWFIKRIVIQMLVIFRFEKLLVRFRWKNELSKADVRYSIYNLVGNIFFVLVFLLFLNSALTALNLVVLSKLVEHGVLFVPKMLLALVIFGIGWWISSRVSVSVVHALIKENIPSASFVGRIVKLTMVVFFSAIVLSELEIAKEIVVIAFCTFMISLGIISILLIADNKNSLKKIFDKNS